MKKITATHFLKISLLLIFCSVFSQSQSQTITTIAGTGAATYTGDGGAATAATIYNPWGVTKDAAGNLYIADFSNNCVRKIDIATGIISTVAGNGSGGFSGDLGPATAANLNGPTGVALDAAGNLYIADDINFRLRKVNTAGIISTIAGNGTNAATGDGGPATAAKIGVANGIAVDGAGNVYYPDGNHNKVRKINAATGIITTVAGTGFGSYSGDGGPATDATLHYPNEVTIDAGGNMYISEFDNHIIRKVNSAGIISTYAGTPGVPGYFGDGGAATAAKMNGPEGIEIDAAGNLFICEAGNNVVRRITAAGIINTLAGTTATGFSGDGGPATAAVLHAPEKATLNACGDLYFSDLQNNRIRKIHPTINGPSTVCAGSTITLEDIAAGGTWSSSDGTIATVGSSTGVVTGVAVGTVTISYSNSVCSEIKTVTVTLAPAAVTGTTNLCLGHSASLTDATAGGIWTSSNTAVVTIGSTSGLITAVSAGSSIITYTLPSTGCYATTTVTVYSPPGPISGSTIVCIGATTTLTNATSGGVWTSSAPGIADVGSTSGVVTGVSVGPATITYTLAVGCTTTAVVTVRPTPSPITGTMSVCQGFSTTLTSTGGDYWSSSSSAIASVGSATGIVTGISAGIATISYILSSTGCYRLASFTVNPLPSPITGSTTVCVGSTTTLSDASSGGTWSSSVPAVATIGSATGTVTGVTAGSSTITYTLSTGCITTYTITVNPLPAAISGTTSLCESSNTILIDGTVGGTWVSSDATIASVGSTTGIVAAVTAGTATISYILTGTGCYSTISFTVNPLPAAITGPSIVCEGATITLSDATAGGIWTSGDLTVVTIGSTTGIVTGVAMGDVTITYSLPTGCFTTTTIDVNPAPEAITGGSAICVGSTMTLTDGTASGTWLSSATGVASVGSLTGLVTGISSGTATISYVLTTTGCYSTKVISVNPLPDPINGGASISLCVGSSTTLTDAVSGGSWISANTGIATIGSTTGAISGVSAGSVIVSYILPTGCFITTTVTVNPLPAAITGPSLVCVGSTITLSDASAGGTWASDNTFIATIGSATGIVSGLHLGSVIMTYMLPTGCYVTDTITVDTMVVAGPIHGYDTVCIHGNTALGNDSTGGIWISSNTSVATIGSVTGLITGVAPGSAIIGYALTNNCGTTYVFDTVVVIDSFPDITGHIGICSGTTDTLHNAVAGGIWTSSNPSVATVNPTTGVVTGVATGTATISYSATSACGSFIATTEVVVNMAPFISTNTIVACQTFVTHDADAGTVLPGTIISGTTSCVMVCDSSVVRYYANAVAGSSIGWVIIGGTVIANYGDSIDVFWHGAGTTGSVSFYDTISHCIGEAHACIQVIEKPHALFAPSAIYICLGDNVSFFDSSTADTSSPIVSTYWDFGDGTGTAIDNPTHTFTTTNDSDIVTLIVKNKCNCTDTFRVRIHISATPGPKIECSSVVCDSEIASYSTTANIGCDTFIWSVIGGTIVSGSGTSGIRVKWDHVGSDGFGYVRLVEPCSVCPDTTTIKVPVILQSPEISGPTIVCTGQQYAYSLPLWPATQYMWGVLGSPGTIISYHDDYKAILQFTTPGTYTIHGWYQNRLKLCGGNVYKMVTVLPSVVVTGPRTICAGDTVHYSVPMPYSAEWTLTNSSGTMIDYDVTNSFTDYQMTTAGIYHLTAGRDVCADPLTIEAKALPPVVDSISGPDTVCLNRVYTYAAFSSTPGTTYNWQITGGTIVPSSGRDSVTVIWTSTGTKALYANLENILPPNCEGPILVKNIYTDPLNPHITGTSSPCADGSSSYTSNYYHGEVYDWKILPDTAGSVVTGNHSPAMSVLWNNYSGTAKIVVIVRRCDSTVYDTMHVTTSPLPTPTITMPDSVCPDWLTTVRVTSGGSSYYWDFGDGITRTTATDTVWHSWPINTTTGDIIYHLRVSVLPGAGSCSVAGTVEKDVVVRPGPVAYITTTSPRILCPGSDPALLVSTVTDNVSGLSYQWYGNTSVIYGATSATYTATVTANYQVVVVAGNGCVGVSGIIPISWSDSCPVGVRDTTGGHSSCGITLNTSNACNTISLSTGGAYTGSWTALTIPPGGQLLPFTNSITATYNVPGIYGFRYQGSFGTCIIDSTKYDTIGIVPNFRWQAKCGPGGTDSVSLRDYTVYLPWWSIDSITWDTSGVRIDTGRNLLLILNSATSYTVTATVYGTRPGGLFTCGMTQPIYLPAQPSALFTTSVAPICENVPIQFTPSSTSSIISFDWDFGDGSTNINSSPQRTYDWQPLFDPKTYFAILKVKDQIGCQVSDTQAIQIYQNNIRGNLGIPSVVSYCSSSLPVMLNWNSIIGSPTLYVWSNGITETTGSIPVNTSGAYWVTVYDAHQCQATWPIPVKQLKIIKPPRPVIYGKKDFCYGDVVQLYGYAGKGVSYNWFRNGSAISSSSSIADGGLAINDYYYQLVISVLDTATGIVCYDSSVVDTIHVHGLPPAPTITGPTVVDCNTYHLQLAATDALPGVFNWSNGVYGDIDDIYLGGPYRVWFTDHNGCVSHNDVDVPFSPESYFPYFPTGCYTICREQLPLMLFGPPHVSFSPWAWLRNDTVQITGTGLMASYSIDTSGNYSWELGNGLCTKTSDEMSVDLTNCDDCDQKNLNATVSCDTSNPASYSIGVFFFNSTSGSTYTLGTDVGPIDPFSGTMASSGMQSLSLTFTTLYPTSLPDSITVQVLITHPDGTRCFQKVRIPLPECTWIAEKPGHIADSTKSDGSLKTVIGNALLVYPNPSSGNVTISYDYGETIYKERSITIYDAMGRRMDGASFTDAHGNWRLSTNDWASGMYIIRMEADGICLQTQRLILTAR